MGTMYRLVNLSKREQISFTKLPAAKAREIAGNPASAAMVAWYLIKNPGDLIGFVADDSSLWPFDMESMSESLGYNDVTEAYIDDLIKEGIIKDCGILWQDEQEPGLYSRDLRNAYMPRDLL